MPRVQNPTPYQKRNGFWYFRIRDEHGCRPERGPYRTRSDAKEAAIKDSARVAEARMRNRALGIGSGRRKTLRDLIGEFRKTYRAAEVTVERHMKNLAGLESAPDPANRSRLFADRILETITPADLIIFLNQYASPHVRMKWCTLWSLLLKSAVDELRWLTKEQSPRAGIRWPTIYPSHDRALWRTPAQVARIAIVMPAPYCYVPNVQVAAGLRTGEALALRPTWIDWERRAMGVRGSSWRRKSSPGKKGTVPREFPLTQRLEDALDAIPDDVWSDELDLCFTDAGGRMLCSGIYAAHWRRACEQLGELPVSGSNRSPYSLRTSLINWHAEAGEVSATDLAKLLGTSVKVIETFYNRQTDERMQRNQHRFDTVFDDLDIET